MKKDPELVMNKDLNRNIIKRILKESEFDWVENLSTDIETRNLEIMPVGINGEILNKSPEDIQKKLVEDIINWNKTVGNSHNLSIYEVRGRIFPYSYRHIGYQTIYSIEFLIGPGRKSLLIQDEWVYFLDLEKKDDEVYVDQKKFNTRHSVTPEDAFNFLTDYLNSKNNINEEVQWDSHPIEVGDVYEVNPLRTFYVRVTDVECNENGIGRKIQHTAVTTYDITHDGCWLMIERSEDGIKWSVVGEVERKWISHLIHIGYWKPISSLSDTNSMFNQLNESEEWFEYFRPSLPEEFVLTFCNQQINAKIFNKFINAVPHYSVGTRFDDGLPDNEWFDTIGRREGGIVMYFQTKGNFVDWEGWDTCSQNSVSSYDYVFSIEEFLKLYEKNPE